MSKNSSFAKIALPYAEALFDSSKEMQLLDETSKDLEFIIENIQKSSRLKSFLANPLFLTETKKNVLTQLFTGRVANHVINFLYVLVDRRRINLLDSVAQCYLDLVYSLQLVLVAEISTAVPLSDLQKQNLQSKLKLMTRSKKIELVECVNPELIGGFVVKVGSKVIDMSIYGQLSQISSYLNAARL